MRDDVDTTRREDRGKVNARMSTGYKLESIARGADARARVAPKVLVVDDEVSMRELLEIVLSNDGYRVVSVGTVPEACAVLDREPIDIVMTDLRIGNDRDAGMTLLQWLQTNTAHIPSIMMTAHGSVETAIEAMKRGATDYVLKPFKNDEIKLLVKRALTQRDLLRENTALRMEQARQGQVDNMVGNSPAIQRVKDLVRRVAALPSTIAIHGESGTGKELIARGIHQLSPRSAKPFVAINCGGIPENLLESELFGHKRGSFTGAIEDKTGLFVMAHGGTLFLDEIGEMPMPLQVKLLRVLDDNVVMPVGGTAGVTVDVRVVSATNRNLEKLAQQGAFREDLYYRLNVIPLTVPPLRERGDDVPLLARHFVKAHSSKLGRVPVEIAEDAMSALQQYAWPGNVRELENVIERAVALCPDRGITAAELPTAVTSAPAVRAEAPDDLPLDGLDLEGLIADIESNLIQQALDRGRHSQKKAAELLGLTPRSLRYRMQKYGLNVD